MSVDIAENDKAYIISSKSDCETHRAVISPIQNEMQYIHDIASKSPPDRFW